MSLPLPLSFCFLFSKEEMPPVVSDIYFLKQMGIFKGAEGDFCSLLQRIAVMDGHLSPKTNVMPASRR